jgi:endonuclease G
VAAKRKTSKQTQSKVSSSSEQKKQKKRNKRLKRIAILAAVLLVCYIILWIFTPSSTVQTSSPVIVGQSLELPALRDNETIIMHTGYSLVYDEEHEQALWVAYDLTRSEVLGTHERADDFRVDPKIKTGSATLEDYRGSGYDRGHLIPAADLSWSEQAMSESFYLSNMSPQDPSFNRGIWSSLEAVVRNFAFTKGTVYVATGPVLTDGPYKKIGSSGVSIPKHYYKVILDASENHPVAIGFILPNEGSNKELSSFAVSVDEVEKITGIDFFTNLDDKIENRIEQTVSLRDWDFNRFQATDELRSMYAGTTDQKAVEPVRQKGILGFINTVMVLMKREIRALVMPFVPLALKPTVSNLF